MLTNEIYIEDLCSEKSLDKQGTALIFDAISKTLEYEDISYPCYVSVSLVDEDEIKAINSEHRGIDKVTDVLSFPVVNMLDGSFDENDGDFMGEFLILGDVVLCAKRAKEQACDFGHSYERELAYLSCHSILHLIGYDHESDDDKAIMRRKEEAVMELLNLKRTGV